MQKIHVPQRPSRNDAALWVVPVEGPVSLAQSLPLQVELGKLVSMAFPDGGFSLGMKPENPSDLMSQQRQVFTVSGSPEGLSRLATLVAQGTRFKMHESPAGSLPRSGASVEVCTL